MSLTITETSDTIISPPCARSTASAKLTIGAGDIDELIKQAKNLPGILPGLRRCPVRA